MTFKAARSFAFLFGVMLVIVFVLRIKRAPARMMMNCDSVELAEP